MTGETTSDHGGNSALLGGTRGLRARWEFAVMVLIIAVYLVLTVGASRHQSVTVDEFAHLPTGLSYLRTGDFRLEAFNSPLTRMIVALPLWHDSRVKMPLQRGWETGNHWIFSYEFMYANPKIYQEIFARSRLIIGLLGAVTVAVLFWWVRRKYGKWSGLAAAGLLAFDPTFLAHSGLVTGDVAATLAFLLAVMAVESMVRNKDWPRTVLAGIAIAAAILSKFSAVVLILLTPWWFIMAGSGHLQRRLLRLLLCFFFVWVTICGFFKFEGMTDPWGQPHFNSPFFSRLQRILPSSLPTLVPRRMLQGMDATMYNNQTPAAQYFFGKVSISPQWYYFLAAFLVKTPLPTLALLLFAFLTIRSGPPWTKEEWFYLFPGLGMIVFVSLASNYNIGLRYILPAYPFLMIFIARPLADQAPRKRTTIILFALGASLLLLADLYAYPHYISYFNRAVGGPQQGKRYLADSNLDWGQGLIELKEYLDRQPDPDLCLVYFGRVDPVVYGIKYRVPDKPDQCKTLAVSVQFTLGLNYAIVSGQSVFNYPPGRFLYLKDRRPTDVIAQSILIFKQPEPGLEGAPGP